MKFQVKIGDQAYSVEIESLTARPIVAVVDGVRFEVWPESSQNNPKTSTEPPCAPPVVVSSPASGLTTATQPTAVLKSKTVNAPIPGVIVEVKVKSGDKVEFGEPLIVIEAMKMRNTIRSPRAGEISVVLVTPGQTVNHNHSLLEFSE